MQLYSIQPRLVYDQLRQGQVHRPRPLSCPDSWLHDQPCGSRQAYDWLCAQMDARLPAARADAAHYPVWAWQQWAGPARARPDLRSSQMKSWSQKERQVLLTLEVPDDTVLLHDYDAWHYPLNYWMLARARASNDFERRCKALGLSPYRNQPLPEPALHAELLQSWQAIFDLPQARRLLDIKRADQAVQATFWELRPEHVRRAVEFGMGRPRAALASP
jgi:hypothetical protein